MNTARIVLGCMIGVSAVWGTAFAQEGLATTSTIGGRNTIQQAPSGGRVTNGLAGGASAGDAGRSDPTPEERQLEQHNKDVTTICKGC